MINYTSFSTFVLIYLIMELQQLPKDKVIMQHNMITSGRYDFTACQLDILFLLLASLEKDDDKEKKYNLYAKDIESITGREWHYTQLQQATEDMGSRMFTIETEKSLKQIWLFSGFEYMKGKGYFTASVSPEARPYLFELKNNFTIFQLKSVLSCSSKYAKRLYTLACQWRTVGKVTIEIAKLKEMLYLKDPKNKVPESFTEVNAFRKHVLEISKQQINTHTDIQFDYELHKKGRSFHSITIFVNYNRISTKEVDIQTSLSYQKAISTVLAYGISQAYAELIAIKYMSEFGALIEQIKKQKNKAQIEDPAAYIVAVFQKKKYLPKR